MKVFSGRKGQKGFTLLEVVLVVGVLAIILAISIPALVRVSRNLKIAKLDDISREIYTSAQSRSIALSVGGQLSRVGGSNVDRPTPMALAEDGMGTVQYKYVYKSGYSAAAGTELLLPLGSIEEGVRQNYYIIEYNPVTAMIKGVYYWENEENDFLSEGYKTIDPENRSERMAYSGGMVGYYGGDDVTRPPIEIRPMEAELVNREELYLRITQGSGATGPLHGTITVTLTDRDNGGEREIASFRNEKGRGNDVNLSYQDGEYKLTLDSLLSELRFSKLFPEEEDGSFHPGCNLMVTVSFREDGKGEWKKDFLTNSLFASAEDTESGRTAYIAFGRHLENLGLLWVYQNDLSAVRMDDDLNGVVQAVQTGAIDWVKSLEEVGTNVPASFKPIVNPNLDRFDGKGNTIRRADIFGDVRDDLLKGERYGDGVSGIGLFSRFAGDSLQNVNLVDCAVKGLENTGDRLYVGLLAGRVDPGGACTVSGCHAYAEAPGADGRLNCSLRVPAGTDGAGGLFGAVRDTTMTLSSASLTEIAGNAGFAGGLAGRSEGAASISECYADTGVWSESGWISGMSGEKVGGLLGRAAGSGTLAIQDCYAVGWVSADSDACGLVGEGGSATVKRCYAALLRGTEFTERLFPEGFASEADAATCIGYTGDDSVFASLGSPFVEATKETTHAYGMPPEMDTYPFPRLSNMPHYGDWPLESLSKLSMAYYEVYQNGDEYRIGFYSKGDGGEVNTLRDDGTVWMDGYALMLPLSGGAYRGIDLFTLLNEPGRPGLSVEYNGRDVAENSLKLLDAKEKLGTEIPGKAGIDEHQGVRIMGMNYYPLFLSSAMMAEGPESGNSLADHDAYYQKLRVKVGGEEAVNVYFNPYVAKSDFAPGTEARPDTPGVSVLRTARQVTAYRYDAMQRTAAGAGAQAHTLRLERDISLADKLRSDATLPAAFDKSCKDLNLPAESSGASANLILELNGRTLAGTGKSSVVTANGGTLRIFGFTAEEPDGEEGGAQGVLAGGAAPECYGVRMTAGTGTLKNVTITGAPGEQDSVSAEGDITLDGCTIMEELS